jgi:hypothetical protein
MKIMGYLRLVLLAAAALTASSALAETARADVR